MDPKEPLKVYRGNKAAISLVHNLVVLHDCTKYVEVDRHLIKEKTESGQILTPFIAVKQQLAYVFSKGISTTKFDSLIDIAFMQQLERGVGESKSLLDQLEDLSKRIKLISR